MGWFSPEAINSLGKLLSFGTIGLGLSMSILAVILMLSSNSRVKTANSKLFLNFSVTIVSIGAGLEVLRLAETFVEQSAERQFLQNQTLPDQFWQDFFEARGSVLYSKRKPHPPSIDGERIEKNETRPITVSFDPQECVFYFAAIRPPARISISILGEGFNQTTDKEREYYKSGRICSTSTDKSNAKMNVSALEGGGQFSVAFFQTLPSDRLSAATTASPVNTTIPKIYKKTICIGEFEGGCPGAHDVWVGCQSEEHVSQQICNGSKATWSRKVTNSGNACGYGLSEFTCG